MLFLSADGVREARDAALKEVPVETKARKTMNLRQEVISHRVRGHYSNRYN